MNSTKFLTLRQVYNHAIFLYTNRYLREFDPLCKHFLRILVLRPLHPHLGRRNPSYIVILSEVARAFAFPALFAGAQTQSKDLSRIENVAVAQIGERFFDCVSRRFAQNQERGTLRSE
jgi:hypothetical protein